MNIRSLTRSRSPVLHASHNSLSSTVEGELLPEDSVELGIIDRITAGLVVSGQLVGTFGPLKKIATNFNNKKFKRNFGAKAVSQ